MSETDVIRLLNKVEDISLKLERMDEKLSDYSELQKSVANLDRRVAEQASRCAFVQAAKTKVNWGTVLGSIIGMVAGGTIMILISKFM